MRRRSVDTENSSVQVMERWLLSLYYRSISRFVTVCNMKNTVSQWNWRKKNKYSGVLLNVQDWWTLCPSILYIHWRIQRTCWIQSCVLYNAFLWREETSNWRSPVEIKYSLDPWMEDVLRLGWESRR